VRRAALRTGLRWPGSLPRTVAGHETRREPRPARRALRRHPDRDPVRHPRCLRRTAHPLVAATWVHVGGLALGITLVALSPRLGFEVAVVRQAPWGLLAGVAGLLLVTGHRGGGGGDRARLHAGGRHRGPAAGGLRPGGQRAARPHRGPGAGHGWSVPCCWSPGPTWSSAGPRPPPDRWGRGPGRWLRPRTPAWGP
jgi:hypothetical protein